MPSPADQPLPSSAIPADHVPQTENALPLTGIRIIELSTLLAAPTAVTLLADFGADVIKIESPAEGDDVRKFPPLLEGESLPWRTIGRNKRSLTIDLHHRLGQDVVHRLTAQSDVVVTNFRLPTLRKWRLDYDDLVEQRPDLVMMHLTAFGRTGPLAERPGFARIAEAFAGLTHITGPADGPPLFSGYPLGDAIGGIFGAYSLLLALMHRERTGEGQLIDLALYEPMVRIFDDLYGPYADAGIIKGRRGNDQDHSCPNGLFPTRDGEWLVLPSSNDNMWQRLTAVLKDPLLQGLNSTAARVAKRSLVDARVAAFTSQHDLDDLVILLNEADIACGRVMTAADIVADEQVIARENLVRVFDETLNRELLVNAPAPRLTRTPGVISRPAPRVGQHSDEILSGILGMGTDEIERLRSQHVV